jgi:transposase
MPKSLLPQVVVKFADSVPIKLVAAIGPGDAFSKDRDFVASLGLVPKQTSTGDRTILGKISKRGNRYLRVLFVQAAWTPVSFPEPRGGGSGQHRSRIGA